MLQRKISDANAARKKLKELQVGLVLLKRIVHYLILCTAMGWYSLAPNGRCFVGVPLGPT